MSLIENIGGQIAEEEILTYERGSNSKDGKNYTTQLYHLCFSSNTITVNKTRKVRWAGYIACGEIRNVYIVRK
jgi:hypothetical protein